MNKQAEKLADLIEKNPNCVFEIDNDCWSMLPKAEADATITSSADQNWMTDWYGDGSNYGAGIAEALVILLNRRGFNITACAV